VTVASQPDILVKPIDELRPAPYNPRIALAPDDAEYQQLKRGIQTFGLVEPLVWNATTGHVVGGHQRLAVLRDLGWTEVPVAVVELDEAREQVLNVALNKITGRWDKTALADLIDELGQDPDFELELIGFTDDDFDTLLRLIDQDDSGSFLDDLLEDLDGDDEDIDTDPHTPDDFKQKWFTMTFPVSDAERVIVIDAINRVKEVRGAETSSDAITYLASAYLAEQETLEERKDHATEAQNQDPDGAEPASSQE
jgi:hypothetical protein